MKLSQFKALTEERLNLLKEIDLILDIDPYLLTDLQKEVFEQTKDTTLSEEAKTALKETLLSKDKREILAQKRARIEEIKKEIMSIGQYNELPSYYYVNTDILLDCILNYLKTVCMASCSKDTHVSCYFGSYYKTISVNVNEKIYTLAEQHKEDYDIFLAPLVGKYPNDWKQLTTDFPGIKKAFWDAIEKNSKIKKENEMGLIKQRLLKIQDELDTLQKPTKRKVRITQLDKEKIKEQTDYDAIASTLDDFDL